MLHKIVGKQRWFKLLAACWLLAGLLGLAHAETVLVTDVTQPLTARHQTRWTNGDITTFGLPTTLGDGTQVFPRHNSSFTSTGGTLFPGGVRHYSLDSKGLLRYDDVGTTGTSTYSPARIDIPPSMVIGQTYEQVYTQTITPLSGATPVVQTRKGLTTIIGWDTVNTDWGTSYTAVENFFPKSAAGC